MRNRKRKVAEELTIWTPSNRRQFEAASREILAQTRVPRSLRTLLSKTAKAFDLPYGGSKKATFSVWRAQERNSAERKIWATRQVVKQVCSTVHNMLHVLTIPRHFVIPRATLTTSQPTGFRSRKVLQYGCLVRAEKSSRFIDSEDAAEDAEDANIMTRARQQTPAEELDEETEAPFANAEAQEAQHAHQDDPSYDPDTS